MISFGFLVFATLATAATPPILSGRASVIDGDTLEIHGQRIRLQGIDAPESGQHCHDAKARKWRCGQKSALALDKKIGRKTVSCQITGTDRYGRYLGTCFAKNTDLNGWMVREGWAVAYVKYATTYLPDEKAAQGRQSGLWQGRFVRPDDWRDGMRLGSSPVARADTGTSACLIKGNIGSSGARIYHLPGMEWYSRTKINTRKGERWFCTESEARAAGWRKAR